MKEPTKEQKTDFSSDKAPDNGFFATSHLRTNLSKRVVRGWTATFIGQILAKIVYLGSVMVLARILTPDDFGLIAMITVVIGFVQLGKDFGLSMATVQREEITHEQISVLFWVNATLGLLLMGIAAVLAPVIAWFYGEERLMWLTMYLSVGLFVGGFSVQHTALLQRQMRLGVLAGLDVGGIFAGSVVGIIAALQGAGVWALVYMELSQIIFRTVAVWIVCPWRPGRPRRGTGVREMLAFGGHLTGFNTINYLASRLDTVLIGWRCGVGVLGFYSRAFGLMLAPLRQMNHPATSVAIPTLSRLVGEPDRYRNAYFRILNQIVLITVPGIALMIGTSDWIVRVVLGRQWGETAGLFRILGFAGLLIPILNTFGWLFITQGRTRKMLQLGFVDAVVKIVSVIVGLHWGVTGVAVAVASRYFLMLPVCLWFVCRRGPIRAGDFLPTFLLAGSLAITVLGAVVGFREFQPLSGSAVGIAGCFAITAAMVAITLFLLPGGRSTIKDTLHSISTLFKREGA